jgi:hypothetical protein
LLKDKEIKRQLTRKNKQLKKLKIKLLKKLPTKLNLPKRNDEVFKQYDS